MKGTMMLKNPTIHKYQLATLEVLFDTFNSVTFNDHGEMVAQSTIATPVGSFVVSFYAREAHFKIYPQGSQPCDEDVFNGYINDIYPERSLDDVPKSPQELKEILMDVLSGTLSGKWKKE
jgi:hypothetical protein